MTNLPYNHATLSIYNNRQSAINESLNNACGKYPQHVFHGDNNQYWVAYGKMVRQLTADGYEKIAFAGKELH